MQIDSKYLIRVDASSSIGVGHVMRCVTLADALYENGAQVEFICREHPGNLIKYIREKGYAVHSLLSPSIDDVVGFSDEYAQWLGVTEQKDAEETLQVISDISADCLIVDHYALSREWEVKFRGYVSRIVVIDDLANRLHECDVLLDTTEGRKATDYGNRVSQQCRQLLGPSYSLLRQQFSVYRPEALKRRSSCSSAEKILVSMGGTDPFNVTSWVLQCIDRIDQAIEIDVILGMGSPYIKTVQSYIAQMNKEVRLHFQVEDMAKFMTFADLAIGTGGSTSWERCCLGLPAVVLITEDNQRLLANALGERGAIVNMGYFNSAQKDQMISVLRKLISNKYGELSAISECAATVCDGAGVYRVVSELVQ